MRVAFLVLELVLIFIAMVKSDLITVVGLGAMFILAQVWAVAYDLDKLVKLKQTKQEEGT